jgi:latrophilin 2
VPANNNNDERRSPLANVINDTAIRLEYYETSFIVPYTASPAVGPHMYNVSIHDNRLLNTHVAFSWNQTYFANSANCDVAALDNITVILSHNGHKRHIYQDHFDDGLSNDWNLTNVTITSAIDECDSNGSCLYFTGGPDYVGVASRQATTKLLDLHIINSITLSYPSSPQLLCNSNERKLIVKFYLQMTQFVQPIPATDSHSNAILLSIHMDNNSIIPLAYYAPVGNYYWPGFDTTRETLHNIPIYSTSPALQIVHYACLSNSIQSISIVWSQENYTIDSDLWSLYDVDINVISDGTLYTEEMWDITNGKNTTNPCVNRDGIIFNKGNGSVPRTANLSLLVDDDLPNPTSTIEGISETSMNSEISTSGLFYVITNSDSEEMQTFVTSSYSNSLSAMSVYHDNTMTVTLSSFLLSTNSIFAGYSHISTVIVTTSEMVSSPTPTDIPIPHCPGDGSVWFDTLGDSNATGTCYRGTVNATRYCRENGVWDNVTCHTSPVFDAILSQTSIVQSLRILIAANDLPLNQRLYLFDSIITSHPDQQLSKNKTELALTFANDIVNSAEEEARNSIGTQLLLTLDTLALNSLETNLSLSVDNIGNFGLDFCLFEVYVALRVQEVVFPLAGDKIVGINVESNSIQLPSDISFTMNDTIKIASFVFRNLSQLLSPQTNERRLISPVISATCINCKKTDLNPQVNISFNLSSQEISPNDNLICVFLDISESNDSLPTSDWSTEGCKQSSYQEENSIITCQCDHLTHFAILLSPRAPDGGVHDEILTVVGYVLTPISLVCMLLVIFTYACMKSLWNMRSYIHIMLCINLFIAQLLFVVGIERTEYLPICSVIAVILQYMYLVSFMWMLMEGVVLYVTLVRVFIKHPKRYIAAFTISSYGIPALYMMIVIPIGFLAGGDHTYYLYYNSNITDRQTNYSTMINGNNNDVVACWLDYESGFIFTFIVPVIAIILANCGFFIMSIFIIWKQLNKQNSDVSSVKHWLKVSISLTVVMGIGWIFNILFFARELLFVAYISVIFIAGQGIVIFIMYVPCSKHVREGFKRWRKVKKLDKSYYPQNTTLTKLSSLSNFRFKTQLSLGKFIESNNSLSDLDIKKSEKNGSNNGLIQSSSFNNI